MLYISTFYATVRQVISDAIMHVLYERDQPGFLLVKMQTLIFLEHRPKKESSTNIKSNDTGSLRLLGVAVQYPDGLGYKYSGI